MSDEEQFQQWAAGAKLNATTIDNLTKEGFSCLDSVIWCSEEDRAQSAKLKAISLGQWRMLQAAIGKLRATEPSPAQIPIPEKQAQPEPQEAEDKVLEEVMQQLGLSKSAPPPLGNLDQASWRDPQVFLRQLGKKPVVFYDIPDFVNGMGPSGSEEVVMESGPQGPQLVIKSGPTKPKLENISFIQWSMANIAVMHRLVEDGKIVSMNHVLDYQSYTVRILQLAQRYTFSSVLLYDREYRRLQAESQFRWGTDLGHHLQSVTLIAKTVANQRSTPSTFNRPQQGGQSFRSKPYNFKQKGPLTSDGQVICLKYNCQSGCTFRDCRFKHVCSIEGCSGRHSALDHNQTESTRMWQGPPHQPKNWMPPHQAGIN